MAWHLVRQYRGDLAARPKLDLPRRTGLRSTPVRDKFRTARLPDADRYWLAFGLGYSWTQDLRVDAAYVHIFSPSPSINEVSQTGDVLVGRYSNHIDLVSLSATLRF